MLRRKVQEEGTFSENSYNLPDSVNSIKWDNKGNTMEVYDYYKGLIALRKAHPAFRMTTTEDVQNNITFQNVEDSNVVAYTIDNSPNSEKAESIYVAYNANKEEITIELPEGKWNLYVNGETAGTEVLSSVSGEVTISPISAVVLIKEESGVFHMSTSTVVVIGVAAAVIVCAAIVVGLSKNNKRLKETYKN